MNEEQILKFQNIFIPIFVIHIFKIFNPFLNQIFENVADWMVGWFDSRLDNWMVDWLDNQLNGWLDGMLLRTDWFADRMAVDGARLTDGWMVGCLNGYIAD